MKKMILMVGLLNLVLLAPGKILFTSNFDGHTGVPSRTGTIDKDVVGSSTAGVTWIRDPSVTAISDLTAICPAAGFLQRPGTTYATPNNIYVNYNMNKDPRSAPRGYSFTFTTDTSWDLATLTVIAGHSNDSAMDDQAFESDLTYTLSGGTLGSAITGTSRENHSTGPAYHTVPFNVTGTTLGAGSYTLSVTMKNMPGGGAYAIYDGITLEGLQAGGPSIESFAVNDYYVTNGAPVTFSWETTGATSISIDQGVGDVTAQSINGVGTTTVNATATSVYTLTVSNAVGVATASLKLGVGPERPNILFFLVDDMGAHDTSVPFQVDAAGNDVRSIPNDFYRTPNMEILAADGMKFTRAYAMPVCTPTRNCLMNGLNSARHHVTTWTDVVPRDTGQTSTWSHKSPRDWRIEGFDFSVTALPALLSAGGYRNIHVGKAHFGNVPGNIDPLDIGFDINIGGQQTGRPGSYYGTSNFGSGTYQVPHLEAYHGQDIFLTEVLTLEMNKAIEDSVNDGVPFFAYMSHYAVHDPYDTDKRFAANYPGTTGNRLSFATLIEGMDKSLGDIRTKLDALGVAEDTLVIFMSDNGSTLRHPDDPLRGYKGYKYEGGTRVPLMAAWSKANPDNTFQSQLAIPSSSVQTDIVACFDLYPTILGVAGIDQPQTVDGHDLRNYFTATPGSHRPQEFIIHFPHDHNDNDSDYYTVYHEGVYKLIYSYASDKYELYNVITDVGEKTDLAPSNPNRVMAMARKMAQQLNDHGAQWPVTRATNVDDPFLMPNLPTVDLDGDGIPDNLEDPNRNGLVDPGETDPDRSDTDGDGIPDGAELRLGTDPLDPQSKFTLAVNPTGLSNSLLQITWPSAPGTLFSIQSSSDLQSWPGLVTNGIPAANPGTTTSYAIDPEAACQLFFRVVLEDE